MNQTITSLLCRDNITMSVEQSINTEIQCDVHTPYIHSIKQCETLNSEDQEKTNILSKTHFKVVSSNFLLCVEYLYSIDKQMLENTLKIPITKYFIGGVKL